MPFDSKINEISTKLLEMADMIERRGLAYGQAYEGDPLTGRLCLVAAVWDVTDSMTALKERFFLRNELILILRAKLGSVLTWSDSHSTKEAVVMLRELACEKRN